jgi:hypothetical protein
VRQLTTPRRGLRHTRVAACAACLLSGVTALWLSTGAGALNARSAQSALTSELVAAGSQTTIPADVQPPVSQWSTSLQPYFSYITTPKGRACFAMQGQTSLNAAACTWGDHKATRVAALIGDSQAYQWLPALDTWGQAAHWRILVLAKATCRPWPSSTYLWSDHATPYPQCSKFDGWVDKTLDRLKPKATFVAAEIGALSTTSVESRSQIVNGVAALRRALARSHTRLIMLQNTPWFWNAPASPGCLANNPSDVSACAEPRANSQGGPNVIEEPMRDAVAEIGSKGIAKILPVDNLVCGPASCPTLSGPLLMYIDDAHLSNLWVNHVEPAFAEMLVKPLRGL